MLPEMKNFYDLLAKLEYDIERYNLTSHIYELLDCLMTLNAIPEWIVAGDNQNESLRRVATEKIKIMKGTNFIFDEKLLYENIDHKLRLVRLICNHAKHKTDSKQIPIITREYDASFPMEFPVKFDYIISIGEKAVDAEFLITEVARFWKDKCGH